MWEIYRILVIFIRGQQNFNSIQSYVNKTFLQKNRIRFEQILASQLITTKQKVQLKKNTYNYAACKFKYLVSNHYFKGKELFKQCLKNCLFSLPHQAQKILLMIETPKWSHPIFRQTEDLLKHIILNQQNQVFNCIYQIYVQYQLVYQYSTQQKIPKLPRQNLKQELLRGLQEIQYRIFPSVKLYGLNTKTKIIVNVYKIFKSLYNLSLIRQKITLGHIQKIKDTSIAFLSIIIMHQLMHYIIRRRKQIKFDLDSSFQFQYKVLQKQEMKNKISFKNYMLENLWSVESYHQNQIIWQKSLQMQKLAYENKQMIFNLKSMVQFRQSQQTMKVIKNTVFFYVVKLIKEQITFSIKIKSDIQHFYNKFLGNEGYNHKKQLVQSKVINFITQSLAQQKLYVGKVMISLKTKRKYSQNNVQKWIKHNLITNIDLNILKFLQQNQQSFKDFYAQIKHLSKKQLQKLQVLVQNKFQKLFQIKFKISINQITEKISSINSALIIRNQLRVLGQDITNRAWLNIQNFPKQKNQKLVNILAVNYLNQFLTYLEIRVKLTEQIPEIFRTKNLELGYILQKKLFPHFHKLQQKQKYVSHRDFYKLKQLLRGKSYREINMGTIPSSVEEQQLAINMARVSHNREIEFDLFNIYAGGICSRFNQNRKHD